MRIPLHVLVLAFSERPSDDMITLASRFPLHEIVSVAKVAIDAVGDVRREQHQIMFNETRRRISFRLSLGERVVLVTEPGDSASRRSMVDLAMESGARTIYLAPRDILAKHGALRGGDGVATVMAREDLRHGLVAQPLPQTAQDIAGKFSGVTVLGDVHGNATGLREADLWARSRGHALCMLGDVLDHGEDPLGAMDVAYEIIMNGGGTMLIGNHERKIARWLQRRGGGQGRPVRLSEGNRATTQAIERLPREQSIAWCGRFRAVLARSSLMLDLGSVVMAHAAVHPSYWSGAINANESDIENLALYGEFEQWPAYRQTHKWVEAVPTGKTVFVGHEMRAPLPLLVTSRAGGRAAFLDTGSGKGGALSSADLRFDGTGLPRLENFNRHG